MRRASIAVLALSGVLLGGCATISDGLDAINPFSSSGPKMTPLQPLKASVELRTVWSTSIGKSGEQVFVPAVVDKAVFVASRDGVIQRIEDGKAVWRISAGQPLSAGVGANARLVVVGTPKGEVLAFSAQDGKRLWQARASSEVLAPPAVGDDGVAVRSGDHRIALFDGETGTRKWIYQRTTPPLSVRGAATPVFADRYVFAGFPGGKLVALAVQNGAPAWEGQVAQPRGATELDRVADVVATPAIDGRQVCAVAFQGKLACFDMAQGGALVWSRDFSSTVGLALDGRYLFVTDDKGAIHALDRLSGSSLWKQDKLLNRKVTAPTLRRGMVIVGDGEGYVHFLSREDGSFVARQKTDGSPIRVPVQPVGASFAVQTTGGTLTVIEAQ